MADLLIAVGGTGQHVALAVARLVFIGALPELELAVIDADTGQELTANLRTFGHTLEGDYVRHPLINGKDGMYSPFNKTDQERPTFADLLLSQNAPRPQRELFELCFDEESARTSVNEGMYGRPAVGATIFAKNFAQPRDRQQLKPVFERAAQADDNIFITGSMVGGTGAGLMHQLVSTLKPFGQTMYGLIFLNWLSVMPSQQRQTISDGTLLRNMKYGLSYLFDKTRKQLKATLLIGPPKDPPADKLKQLRIKEGNNQETPHFFHLMAAYGIYHLPSIAVKVETDGSIYAAAYDSDSEQQMYKEVWAGGKPLHWYVSRALFVKTILDYVGSPRFRKEFDSAFGTLFNKPQNVGRGLFAVISNYGSKERSTVIDVIVKTWGLLARQYAFALSWLELEQVLGPLPSELRIKGDKKYASIGKKGDTRTGGYDIPAIIQELWDKTPEMGQEKLEPANFAVQVAHTFHRLLVESFQ